MADPWGAVFAKAALQTLQASRWTVLMARMFGKRVVGADDGHVVTGHYWRGKFYLTDYRAARPNA